MSSRVNYSEGSYVYFDRMFFLRAHAFSHFIIYNRHVQGTVQLISKLTPVCAEHACVLQFLLSDTRVRRVRHATGRTCATFRALHMRDIRVLHASGETARESDFVCCT